MRPLVLAAALALTAVGCSSTIGEERPATPSSPSVTKAAAVPAVPLSAAQAKKAILSVRDLPPHGWTGGTAVESSPREDRVGTYDPAECVVIRHALHGLGKPSREVMATFTRARDPYIGEVITSWPVQQKAVVLKVADALNRCTTFKLTDVTGEETTFAVRQVPLSGLPDAIAMRLEETDGLPHVTHIAWAARGGGVLRLEMGHLRSEAEVVQTVTKATARLEAVTK